MRPSHRLPLAAATLFSAGLVFACSRVSDEAPTADDQEIREREDLFDKTEHLPLTLSAPLTQLFTRLRSGQRDPTPPVDGGRRPREYFYSEAGKLTVPGKPNGEGIAEPTTFDVRVWVRGESSEFDCRFNKLKITFEKKEQLKGTLFKGHGTIRLNTHCGPADGPGDVNARSVYGRVFHGTGPVREELIYRLIRAADVPTYLTRVTKITYDDAAANMRFDSFAMILESGDDAAQRFAKQSPPLIEPDGGAYLDPENGEASGKATAENMAQIKVAEALSGNQDWSRDGTHNLDVFGIPHAPTILKIPVDFDLCPIVHLNDKLGDAVSNASSGLRVPGIAAHFLARKADVETALARAEKDAIAAGAIPSADGHTSDPGFLKARERVAALYALPELAAAPPP